MRWSARSPRRRLLFGAVAALLVAGAVLAGARVLDGDGGSGRPAQDRPGPVVLVPGYGGTPESVSALANRIRATGREVRIVTLPGDGTGDLLAQAAALDREIGDGPVDLVGYSAGGVVARLWMAREDGARYARRVITLGSPLHGTRLAASGAVIAPDACPVACQQLAPGSALLTSVEREPVPVPWLSIWTENDQTVIPPDSARLDGAENLALQDLCPGVHIEHGALVSHPLPVGLVLRALGTEPLPAVAAGPCPVAAG